MILTVSDVLKTADDYRSVHVKLVLHYLIHEKRVLELESPIEKLEFYLQDRFKDRLNSELDSYKNKILAKKGLK